MITEYPFQIDAADRVWDLVKQNKSNLLIGATGTGKTFIYGRVLEKMFQHKLLDDCKAPFPIFYLTKSSVVQQTQEVLFKEYKLPANKIFVTNYDQLRASLGDLFISWQERYNASLTDKWLEPLWRSEFMPKWIFADECQAMKNEDTLQFKLMYQFVKQGGLICAASATPFTRVCEGKFCTVAIRPYVDGFGYIKDLNWQHFANVVAGSRSSPYDWNSEATARLTKVIEPNIVRVRNVKFKKRTFTHCKLIDFQCAEDARYYAQAYEDYLNELAKIDKDAPGGVAAIWVAQTKFRIRAEIIKAPYLASIAKQVVTEQDKQVIIASNYVKPLEIIKAKLISLGVPETEIAIIIGGQSKELRQENIKRFQSGIAKYCLFTLKSGGVGLSLHHHDGNAQNCKPRYVILPPTWSAIELVQALGRAHRINSISTTYQDIVWFNGTIESEVAEKVARKLKSLSEIVSKKETWSDVFSRRTDLADIAELKQLAENESTDSEDGDEHTHEEFVTEAYENPSDDEVKEIELELV